MDTAALIVGIMGIVLNLAIYQQNTSKGILIVKLTSNVVWAAYYLLLGAYEGFCVACIAIARETTFISIDRKGKWGIPCLSLFALTSIVCSILTWKSPASILPALASITAVFGFYFAIPKLSRILALPVALCMGIYDFGSNLGLGLANESITFVSAIIGIICIDILKREKSIMQLDFFKKKTAPKDQVRVGVVQWDCSLPSDTWWGYYQTRTLSPKKFRTATPYYADILGEDKIDYHWRTQEEFDREIEYAIEAGIDYFAYVFYPEHGSKEHTPTSASDCSHMVHELRYAYKGYLNSKWKDKISMAAIMGKHPFAEPDYLELAELLKQPFYEKVNGRPLVYLYWRIDPVEVECLLKAVEKVGGEKPLLIGMFGGKLPMYTRYDLVDGLSAYSCGKDSITTHLELVEYGMEENIWHASAKENELIEAKNINLYIPLYPVGWDPTPRVDIPSPWTTYPATDYAAQPTEDDLLKGAELFADKIKTTPCLRDTFFGHILMFAWNEFEEGAWICPTYNEDLTINTDKVHAVAKMIKYWKETL